MGIMSEHDAHVDAKEFVRKKLTETGIDPARRAESLTIEEWVKLTKLLFPSSSA